jgi:hypothetical protein
VPRDLIRGRRIWRGAHRSPVLAGLLCGLVHVRKLKDTNKEEEELVDVAPHWGEPRISCVDVLCAMLFMMFMYLSS